MRVSSIITNVAAGYVGYQEIQQNQGFEHPVFQKLIKQMEWMPGLSWCSFFCELVYYEVYDHLRDEIEDIFSASATQTWLNFKRSDWTTSNVPVNGALAVWQKYQRGKADWRGHIAVVESFTKDTITTIDGNSNSDGSSNGYEVARVKRVMNWNENNGLRLLGFIIPKEI